MSYYICGIDEVGRGCLAGPILAVAAMFKTEKGADWTKNCPIPGVKDSKAFANEKKREEIYRSILRSSELVDFGIGQISVSDIEKMGIDEANRMVFYHALMDMKHEPNFILVDGENPCPVWPWSHQEWKPRGDGLWWPVGAASVLAKVIRDQYMTELGRDYPHYGWDQNSGYGTASHVAAIKKFGSCALHRKHFLRKIESGAK